MKRRVVMVALVAFALWPLAQRGLVWTFDVSPWKLGGWAMYTAPAFSSGVVLLQVTNDKITPIAPSRYTPRIRNEVGRLASYRAALGRLASPDRLGRAVFEERPEWPVVVVVVDRRRLDGASARIVRRIDKFLYREGERVDEDSEESDGRDRGS